MEALFFERLREYFPGKEEQFLRALAKPASEGFFFNTTKGTLATLAKEIDFAYETYPLNAQAYFHHSPKIGHHPAFVLGLLYAQEPSASLPASLPSVENVHLAIDLCAAPGGKSCGLLNRLSRDATLIANDYQYGRAQILSSNIERLGYGNVLVSSLPPRKLADQLAGKADLVILDAPCSGEGMLRKDPRILQMYSLSNIHACALRQSELLEDAYRLCASGGDIVYSTCTYAPEEDELQVLSFLKKHPDMHLIPFASFHGETMLKVSVLEGSEGQFMALLRKDGTRKRLEFSHLKEKRNKIVDQYLQANFTVDAYHCYEQNGRYFVSLRPLIDYHIPFLRYGIPVGEVRNQRLLADHGLYRAEEWKNYFRHYWELNEKQYHDYVRGYELPSEGPSGDVSVRYHGYLLGYGKRSEGRLKNKYPKGLRRMI